MGTWSEWNKLKWVGTVGRKVIGPPRGKEHMGHSPYISIVIPAYNEENRIGQSLETVFAFFRREGIDHEIVVVNDGSRDRTADVVASIFRGSEHGVLIDNRQNQGKGFSVRNGMLAARGQYLIFSDADLST